MTEYVRCSRWESFEYCSVVEWISCRGTSTHASEQNGTLTNVWELPGKNYSENHACIINHIKFNVILHKFYEQFPQKLDELVYQDKPTKKKRKEKKVPFCPETNVTLRWPEMLKLWKTLIGKKKNQDQRWGMLLQWNVMAHNGLCVFKT